MKHPTSIHANPSTPVTYRRRMRNLLLDAPLQIRYTGVIVGLHIFLSSLLVGFLWKTSNEVVRVSEQATLQGQRAIDESRKVSDVVRMSLHDDPVYGQNTELLATFQNEASKMDRQLEVQKAALADQQRAILRQQRTMIVALISGLTAMVFALGFLGLYLTHKIAGPIFKLKRQLAQLKAGVLARSGNLRKGDELQDFFQMFSSTVQSLREQRQGYIDEISAVLDAPTASAMDGELHERLKELRDRMQRSLIES